MEWTSAIWLVCMTSSLVVSLSLGVPNQMFPYDTIDDDPEDERWLGDGSFYDIDQLEDNPQADGPGVVELCPPVPKILPPGGCALQECSSDRECQAQALRCCYNGCVYTCLPQVLPAPFFDWLREPRRRRQFGQSWLVPGPRRQTEVTMCSTTPPDDDSDPLLCPHGYQCMIDDPGNPLKGIPNTGHCIMARDNSRLEDFTFRRPSKAEDFVLHPSLRKRITTPRDCQIGDAKKLLHGHSIILKGQKCFCRRAKLICKNLKKSTKKGGK